MVPLFEVTYTMSPEVYRLVRKSSPLISGKLAILYAAAFAAAAGCVATAVLGTWLLFACCVLLLAMCGLVILLWVRLPFLIGSQRAKNVVLRFYGQELIMTSVFGRSRSGYERYREIAVRPKGLLLYTAKGDRAIVVPNRYAVGTQEELVAFLLQRGLTLRPDTAGKPEAASNT